MTPGTDGPTGREAIGERLDGLAALPATLAGVTAVLVGYLLTVGIAVVGSQSLEGQITGVLTLLAFVFYSAHGVPVSLGDGETLDWLGYLADPATADSLVPVIVYYAVPIVVALAAGYVVQDRFVREQLDPVQTAAAVGLFALGYALPFVLGTVLATTTTAGGGTVRLVTTDAALFGTVYPLVFGVIGAGIATGVDALRRQYTGDSTESR